jgi:hypothetical protein
MTFIKKQKVPNHYAYNKECLKLTKKTLACLDKIEEDSNYCSDLIKSIVLCKKKFKKENLKSKQITLKYN